MNPNFVWKLSFKVWKINIGAQKINGSTLETFGIIIVDFQVKYKVNRPRFFQKVFLVTNIKFEIILEILFLKLGNIDILFGKKTLTWKIYTTNAALPTTELVQIINKKNFVIAALDINSEMLVVNIAIQE